jgi:predicted amino acid racemase
LRNAERFMPTPYLSIDLDGIAHNARCIVDLCTSHGIEVTGVTKGVCGHPAVAQAMLAGGVGSIGDSRMINVDRLRRSGITADLMMLRLPALSERQPALRVEGSVTAIATEPEPRPPARCDRDGGSW